VVPVPDVHTWELGPADAAIVLATDGLWGVLDAATAAAIVLTAAAATDAAGGGKGTPVLRPAASAGATGAPASAAVSDPAPALLAPASAASPASGGGGPPTTTGAAPPLAEPRTIAERLLAEARLRSVVDNVTVLVIDLTRPAAGTQAGTALAAPATAVAGLTTGSPASEIAMPATAALQPGSA
jgi:hypothetical protein